MIHFLAHDSPRQPIATFVWTCVPQDGLLAWYIKPKMMAVESQFLNWNHILYHEVQAVHLFLSECIPGLFVGMVV